MGFAHYIRKTGTRRSATIFIRGFAPEPPRPLSYLIMAAGCQDVLRMGFAHYIRKTGTRRSGRRGRRFEVRTGAPTTLKAVCRQHFMVNHEVGFIR